MKNRSIYASTIQKGVKQHVKLATDLAMDSHVRHRQVNVKLYARIVILRFRMRTVSSTINLHKCLGNRVHSKAYASSATCANFVGRLFLREARDHGNTDVGRPHQMIKTVIDAEVAIGGACLAISSP